MVSMSVLIWTLDVYEGGGVTCVVSTNLLWGRQLAINMGCFEVALWDGKRWSLEAAVGTFMVSIKLSRSTPDPRSARLSSTT